MNPWGGEAMSVVKIIELVGESPKSWDDAIRTVIAEAQKTLRGITRIGVEEFDVRMNKDKIDVFRVRAKVSFRLER
jgi:flavin-binding protein dodecin